MLRCSCGPISPKIHMKQKFETLRFLFWHKWFWQCLDTRFQTENFICRRLEAAGVVNSRTEGPGTRGPSWDQFLQLLPDSVVRCLTNWNLATWEILGSVSGLSMFCKGLFRSISVFTLFSSTSNNFATSLRKHHGYSMQNKTQHNVDLRDWFSILRQNCVDRVRNFLCELHLCVQFTWPSQAIRHSWVDKTVSNSSGSGTNSWRQKCTQVNSGATAGSLLTLPVTDCHISASQHFHEQEMLSIISNSFQRVLLTTLLLI